MSERRSVRISGVGLLCPGGIGPEGALSGGTGAVPGFRARNYIDDRKALKLMTTSVRLGVAAVRMALEDDGEVLSVPPERRGLFVGTSPQPGDPEDLGPALAAARDSDGRFDIHRFSQDGYPMIHPLWLVRGLSNNIIGFASAIHDLQGVNMNYCHGMQGGWTALQEGVHAIAEGRADVVVAGGADACTAAQELIGGPSSDGAAFVVLRPGEPDIGPILCPDRLAQAAEVHGYLGAASWPVALARSVLHTKS